MAISESTPIIVGVGEICDKDFNPKQPREPAELILEATRRAIGDTRLSDHDVVSLIDSVSMVPPWTWPYDDLPGLVADKLGCKASHFVTGIHGGNQPAMLCDEAARRISKGEARFALVAGGEALASLAASQKAGQPHPPGWAQPGNPASALKVGDLSRLGTDVGARHSIGLPIHVYPLYENGLRSRERKSQKENTDESAKLYAAFDEIACRATYSWRFGETPRDAATIATVTPKNRMICSPYPLLMNAFNTVNLAAACVLTSVGQAKKFGIPEKKWTYILGGAGTTDSDKFWERTNYFSSQAISQSIDAALNVSGLQLGDIDCFDFYSCFPIVPKLACRHLGLDVVQPQKPISLLGGLTSFGGAGNNYSMHAITEMTRQLRENKFQKGLVLANGGVLTYQHVICLSAQPPTQGSEYAKSNPLPLKVGLDAPVFDEYAEGDAYIETFTVEYHRNGSPRLGHIIGRLERNKHRFIAHHGDESTLTRLADPTREPIGLRGTVSKAEDGRSLFFLSSDAKL